MKDKIKVYRNGWNAYATRESSGMYTVLVRDSIGNMHDKVRCDDYRNAMDYYKSFCAIARNG